MRAGPQNGELSFNDKEPVRPRLHVENKAAEIGGLEMDEKTKRENDEALEAAYQDEEPSAKKMRRDHEEAEGPTREGDQTGAPSFPDQGSGRVNPPVYEPADDEEPGEAHKVRAVKDPGEPSSKDVEEHRMRNHVPFRIWCPYCLAAKAKERGHFSK